MNASSKLQSPMNSKTIILYTSNYALFTITLAHSWWWLSTSIGSHWNGREYAKRHNGVNRGKECRVFPLFHLNTMVNSSSLSLLLATVLVKLISLVGQDEYISRILEHNPEDSFKVFICFIYKIIHDKYFLVLPHICQKCWNLISIWIGLQTNTHICMYYLLYVCAANLKWACII